MSARSRAAVGVWRARRARTAGDRGYLAYLALLVALVVVAPLARAIWLNATSPAGVALFASPGAPAVAVVVVAVLWAAALLWGRQRGPAVLPSFVTYALAASDLPRADAFRGAAFRNGAVVSAVTTAVAALAAGSLMSQGATDVLGLVVFTAVGAMVGVIASVAWLVGQALPRFAAVAAVVVGALGLATALVPSLLPFTPWGWVGLAYPGASSPQAGAALCALAAVLVFAAPTLLNRLDIAGLTAQAARWEAATGYVEGMDLQDAVAVYRARPDRGRQVRAVRASARPAMRFLLRDAMGAARTPGRLIAGLLTLAGAGVLVAFAFAPGSPGLLLGAAAGLLVFAGMGPLTDGLRHAVNVAADFPLYGISDERLLAHHLLFPLTAVLVVLLTAALICAVAGGIPLFAALPGALVLGLLALTARVSNALKGPLPPVLLSPIPTPAGDLAAAIRLAWALEAVLVVALAGSAVALMFPAPALVVAVTAGVLAVGIVRWRRRA